MCKKGVRFSLNFYETHPIKRFSRLFLKPSYIQLPVLDPKNIDFHAL